MKIHFAFIMTVLLLAPAVRAADDEDKPIEQQKAEMRHEAASEVQQLKPVKAEKIEDVVQFSIEGNNLAVATKLKPTEGSARLDVAGLPGYSKITVIGSPINSLSFIQQTFPSDALLVMTSVFSVLHSVRIFHDEDRFDERRNIQLIQSDPFAPDAEHGIVLYVNISKKMTGEVVTNVKLPAENIMELRRRYPAEVAKYVEPIFRDLHQEAVLGQVDPKLAWQVFAPLFKAPPELEAKVKTLAKALDADSFSEREGASAQLQKLSPPAAIVLLRMDRTGMSEEQRTRMDALIAPYKPLPDEDAARLRKDRFFLIDCLYGDDVQIRTWALGELQKSMRMPVAFDLNAPKGKREEAVGKLRAMILGTATRPAASGATTAGTAK
jgi:hypothetical protein